MRQLHAVFLILCLIALNACTTIVRPQSTEDGIYTAYAAVGASYRTISDLAKRKAITKEQGVRMIGSVDSAKALVDTAATAFNSGNEVSAVNALSLANTILVALEQELKDTQGGK